MVTPLDIFLIRPGGELVWRGSATSVDGALKSIGKLAKTSPGDYVVINLDTRKQFTINAEVVLITCGQNTLGSLIVSKCGEMLHETPKGA